MASLSDYETSYSRNVRYRGKKFYGVRLYEGTKTELEVYATSYAVDSGNIWPGYADEWSATTDYVVGNTVMGDGVNNTYVYICIVAHEVLDEGPQRPPNSTYWARVQYAPFIRAYELGPMRRRPGKHLLRTFYEKPTTRDVLRRNPGQAILEMNISAEAVKVYQEPATPAAYAAGTAYVVGDRVTSGGGTYICIQNGTGQTPSRTSAYWRASSRIVEGPAVGAKWSGAVTYAEGDLVWHETDGDGRRTVYRSILNAPANLNKEPGTETTYWEVANVKWVPLNGSNTRLRGKAIMRLVSVTSTFDPDTHIGKIGYANSTTVPKMGSFAGIGKLLFIGYKTRKNLAEDGLSDVEYYFLYDPDGWTGGAVVQRMRKVICKQAVLNEDGTDSGDTARVVMWMPDPIADAVPAEERNMTNGLTSFAAFNAMLEWDT